MTCDNNGQGLINFSEVFETKKGKKAIGGGHGIRRKSLSEAEAVPVKEVRDLNTVRIKSGFNCKEIADAAGLTNNFVYRALHERQLISREDFDRILLGWAKLAAKKVLDA